MGPGNERVVALNNTWKRYNEMEEATTMAGSKRRRWTAEEKLRVLEEGRQTHGSVAEVCRQEDRATLGSDPSAWPATNGGWGGAAAPPR
jgi:transposase-like protein